MSGFVYPPSPTVLNWLSAGQFASRIQRAMRLWVLLQQFYGLDSWAHSSLIFRYGDVRDRLFSPHHPRSDTLAAQALTESCSAPACLCHKSLQDWLSETVQLSEWLTETAQLTGLSQSELAHQLLQCPFATVHRSIRDDLKLLSRLGWLQALKRGQYCCVPAYQLPSPPTISTLGFPMLSVTQMWELLRVLEAIAFVQPNLQLLVQLLWEQVTHTKSLHLLLEPTQRIFVHLDYILSEETQEHVDDLQTQIEQLWQTPNGGVIQFETWLPREERKVEVIVYPVCLHYARRAKYLSAYGRDPTGKIAWHNYRLDRIASGRLQVLNWDDQAVPKELKQRWRIGQLPTPTEVQAELDAAWGFNFYLPRQLLIMRFPAKFARWYVENTVRHPTFRAVAYEHLSRLIHQEITNSQERQQLLERVRHCSDQDVYYCAWVRAEDINVIMRLRDWRPNGEVIAPVSLRSRIAEETEQELKHYRRLT